MCTNLLKENIQTNNEIKILFVDDKSSFITISSLFLKKYQKNEIAHNYIDALRKLYTTHFDLIITEAHINDVDGTKFIEKARNYNSLIPIIVLSSGLENNELVELMQLDVSGFISKPIDKKELFLSIENTIKKIELKKITETHKSQLVEINNDLENQMIQRISEIYALNEEIKETQREVIFTMGSICENRSKETGNHVRRVTLYSEVFAKHYGLDKEDVLLLKEASPMHDIGKIAIPDSILNKAGSLTPKERVIMNTHTTLGYEMLRHSKRKLLQIAATVSYEHHEKYDGSGYPRGLKGEEISIYGRIIALADVFDALGSDRCYKKAWEDEKIFAMIKDQKGKHFDPKLVDIFFENIEEFFEIRNKYIDVLI